MNLMSNKSFFTCNLLIQQKLSKLEFNQNTTFNSGMSKISLTPQLTWNFLALQLRRVLRRWPTFKLLCMCCTPFGSHSPFCSWALDAPFLAPTYGQLRLVCSTCVKFQFLALGAGLQWGNCCNEVLECQSAGMERPGRSGLTLTHANGKMGSYQLELGSGDLWRCNFDIIFDKLLTKRLPNC